MRINLKTPYAEKDQARALGARWDAAQKTWYITDPSDLAPFARWIPDLAAATRPHPDGPKQGDGKPGKPDTAGSARKAGAAKLDTTAAGARADRHAAVTTQSERPITHCGCIALPWEDCPHSMDRET